jgi:hypothetical protein
LDIWLWLLGRFLLTTASRSALGPAQPPIRWVLGALSLGVKQPPSSAEDKNAWRYNSTHPIRLNSVVLS